MLRRPASTAPGTSNTPPADLQAQLGLLKNFCFWLQQHGLLRHTLLLTLDER